MSLVPNARLGQNEIGPRQNSVPHLARLIPLACSSTLAATSSRAEARPGIVNGPQARRRGCGSPLLDQHDPCDHQRADQSHLKDLKRFPGGDITYVAQHTARVGARSRGPRQLDIPQPPPFWGDIPRKLRRPLEVLQQPPRLPRS